MQIADACFYKGKKLYEKGKFDEAVLLLREAALSEPDNASMQMLMGSCCLNLGYTRDCIEAFERAADLLNDSTDGQFALGFACAALDRHAEAVAPLRKAIQADSRDIHACYWLGLSLTETGDLEAAIEAFGQVVLLCASRLTWELLLTPTQSILPSGRLWGAWADMPKQQLRLKTPMP
jgi:Flp pilus assembly protein TadD